MAGDTRRQGASRAKRQTSWPGRPRAGKEGAVALCKHGSVKQLSLIQGRSMGAAGPSGRAWLSGWQGVEQGQPPLVIPSAFHTLSHTHMVTHTHTVIRTHYT